MSALATTLAIAVTLAGIGRLAATDPKRRRSFDLPAFRGNRQVELAMTAVLLPPVLLLAIGSGADFVAWLGAVSVAGWAVAALPPRRPKPVVRWPAAADVRVAQAAHAGGGDVIAGRIEALEQRMEAVEAAIAAATRPPALAAEDRRASRFAGFQAQRAADA